MKTRNTGFVLLIVLATIILGVLVLGLMFTGQFAHIGALDDFVATLRGELIGNDYNITEYDNFGNAVFTAHGNRITMNGQKDSNGEESSYVDITIDGYEWQHVGSTLVFAQNGIDMITDFQIPSDFNVSNNEITTGLMVFDRKINSYRNFFGKKAVVLVSSQNGIPIGLFQGDVCTVTIPGDLPKMTRATIDGKQIYVHRGNIDIFPVGMFNTGTLK